MTGQKKGFASFIRPQPDSDAAGATPAVKGKGGMSARLGSSSPPANIRTPSSTSEGALPEDGRVRTVTSTGRVRTYSASRALPGLTFRVSEERWERLKMMSIQERRPLQEILGEAMERYMRERGLPW